MEFLFLHLLTHSFFCTPGTPYLSVYQESPSKMIWEERITITMKGPYEGLTNENGKQSLQSRNHLLYETFLLTNLQIFNYITVATTMISGVRMMKIRSGSDISTASGTSLTSSWMDTTLKSTLLMRRYSCASNQERAGLKYLILILVIYTRIQRSVAPIGSSIGAATLNGGFGGAGKNMLIPR